MNEPYVQITVILPICLHLDERIFCYNVNGKNIEITTKNIVSKTETWLGTAHNMEVDSDEFSHFRFTQLMVKIQGDGNEKLNTVLEDERTIFFNAINKFIDCCRLILKRYGLSNYFEYHQFRSYSATIIGPSREPGLHVFSLTFGRGLTWFKNNHSETEHQEIQRLLNASISLPDFFISDAKRFLYHYDTLRSLLSATTALEIKLSDTIMKLGIKKGIPESALKNYIHDVGLTGNIKVTIKLIIPDAFTLPEDNVFDECKGAITIRNDIIHEGRRDVIMNDVKNFIPQIEKMIHFCETIDYSL